MQGRTLQGTPHHEIGGSQLVTDEERAEREVVVQRVERSNELRERGHCGELLRELDEGLGLT